jgi:hypothetical protein
MPPDPLTCQHHERLASDIGEIKATVFRIEDKLGEGQVKFAKHGVRLGILEKVVYGVVGLVLMGVVGGVLAFMFGKWGG